MHRKKSGRKHSKKIMVDLCGEGPAEEVGLRMPILAIILVLAFNDATGARHLSKCFTGITILVTAWGGGTIILPSFIQQETEVQEGSHLPMVLLHPTGIMVGVTSQIPAPQKSLK